MDKIHKIGAIILKNKKILVAKKKNKFIIPGGRVEEGEDDLTCLKRELLEELKVDLITSEYFGRYEHDAALDPGMKIKMRVYFVKIAGEPIASSEISEIAFVNSHHNLKMGSIVTEEVIPELVKRGLIE